MRIYIAGPMRGIPDFNFPAFDACRDMLQMEFPDAEIMSPADIDRANGFDLEHYKLDHWTRHGNAPVDWATLPPELDFRKIVRRDLNAIQSCTHLFLLDGWMDSRGALAEFAVARWLGLEIYLASTMERLTDEVFLREANEDEPQESVLMEAHSLVNGDRQNQYGPPDQDFRRTASMWSALFGHRFKPSDVALAMVALKLSRQTHQQKRDNWVDIAGYAHCGNVCGESEVANG